MTRNFDNTGLAAPRLCKGKIGIDFIPRPIAEMISKTVSRPARKDLKRKQETRLRSADTS